MGGQQGGMTSENGHFPEICKKSIQTLYKYLYCQKDFRPSWFDEPDLNEKELKFFDKV